ncbi:pancreatic triacylglycerol lipase isoform X1 [Pieris rapae]|uniref:pancreatic triacylglycerol lipase isoform X1 n=2 Tax=Pieris rapae TaxID=64459 RepID=UPI001E2813C9|nr:pancreatic triacylglycerol lipase isoform X1 [Pieris rapae]
MRLLVALSVYVALCTGSVILNSDQYPPVPGDNSHYVEGVSRYIWMPDGDNKIHLVDLKAKGRDAQFFNGFNNQYWLYTRRNPTNHQVLKVNDDNSIRNSNYNGNLPTKVVVHGWNSKGSSSMNPMIRDAFLRVGDYNVIVVDWRRAASGVYTTSVRSVPGIGHHLGHFLNWLISRHGGNWNNVHLVGFSLGAHVVGNAGRTVGGRVGRITGLDPAGPQWGPRNSNTLSRNDGRYVETIHTDGGKLGIFDVIADADFYPNGGRHRQPGCSLSPCSHSRSYELFAASVTHDHFVGRQCANLNEARNQRCNGRQHKMGNARLNKSGSGLYGLTTGSRHPF